MHEYDVQAFGKVAVLLGGSSAERDISLESGSAVLKALQESGVNAHGFDPEEKFLADLIAENYDAAFIVLHGRGGEDGVIQGALESLGIPYTGSGVLGSALGMDKSRSKRLWLNYGLPTAQFVELKPGFDADAVIDALGLPMMIKPAREGSSIGVSKVNSAEELQAAFKSAWELDSIVLAEQFVTGGGEYTVPILNGRALPMIQLKTSRDFYDYEAKYLSDDTEYLCPCGLGEEKENEIAEMALQAFTALDCAVWGRIDVLLDAEMNPWLIEANTVPGMTSHSLVPMAAKETGMSFEQLVLEILSLSLKEKRQAGGQ